MNEPPTLLELADKVKNLEILHNDLVARVISVEQKAKNDKDDAQEELKDMRKILIEVQNKVDSLESLEDANFLAVTHMLGVIGRKLGIPKKELKTGAR